MFGEQIRRAIEAAPRTEIYETSKALWQAWGSGAVSDAEAQELSDLIEAKRAVPALQSPPRRRVGSRPRSPSHIERRRTWASCGLLPARLRANFTCGEAAVLCVVAAEVRKRGECILTVGEIADVAGVSPTTVRNALRAAQALVRVEERRVSAWRNLPNRITIISPEWVEWLRLRPALGGCNFAKPSPKKESKRGPAAQRIGLRATDGQRAFSAACNGIRDRLRMKDQRR